MARHPNKIRLLLAAMLLGSAYWLALQPTVRNAYAPWDKLAHGIAFSVVWLALLWSLRWPPKWAALLAALLGGGVELQQRYFLVGFIASWGDWLADLAGIALAWGLYWFWRHSRRAPCAPRVLFESAVAALPLVSVDWVLTNPAGELLVGRRLNAPARDTWFTPGGRIRKGEALRVAMRRVAREELGAPIPLAEAMVQRAAAMGAWDHFYPDSAFSPTVPTHYVNLPFAATLSEAEVESLRLPVGEQHGHWRWISLAQAAQEVHAHVQPYVEWLRSGATSSPAPSSFSSSRLAGSEITL